VLIAGVVKSFTAIPLDQALLGHVQNGLVTMEDALKASTHPHDFKLLVSSGGQRSTSVQQALDEQPVPAPAAG